MAKRAPGLTWLKKGNHKQLPWAANYLRDRGYLKEKNRIHSYDELLRVGEWIENSHEGYEVLSKMKNAWRQKQQRDLAHTKDRSPFTFTLSNKTKKQLEKLASRYRKSQTEVLEQLILQASENMSHKPRSTQAPKRDDEHSAKSSKTGSDEQPLPPAADDMQYDTDHRHAGTHEEPRTASELTQEAPVPISEEICLDEEPGSWPSTSQSSGSGLSGKFEEAMESQDVKTNSLENLKIIGAKAIPLPKKR